MFSRTVSWLPKTRKCRPSPLGLPSEHGIDFGSVREEVAQRHESNHLDWQPALSPRIEIKELFRALANHYRLCPVHCTALDKSPGPSTNGLAYGSAKPA